VPSQQQIGCLTCIAWHEHWQQLLVTAAIVVWQIVPLVAAQPVLQGLGSGLLLPQTVWGLHAHLLGRSRFAQVVGSLVLHSGQPPKLLQVRSQQQQAAGEVGVIAWMKRVT
jgi:hypothetical protein